MIRIKVISQPQVLSSLQSNQLVELHQDFVAYQKEIFKTPAGSGPTISITPGILFENNVIACAFDDADNVVGYILFRNLTGELNIRCIYVNPQVRQLGVMTAMLNAILRFEAYHKVSANLPPKTDAVAAYFESNNYTKVRDQMTGWLCYFRDFVKGPRPLTDRPQFVEYPPLHV